MKKPRPKAKRPAKPSWQARADGPEGEPFRKEMGTQFPDYCHAVRSWRLLKRCAQRIARRGQRWHLGLAFRPVVGEPGAITLNHAVMPVAAVWAAKALTKAARPLIGEPKGADLVARIERVAERLDDLEQFQTNGGYSGSHIRRQRRLRSAHRPREDGAEFAPMETSVVCTANRSIGTVALASALAAPLLSPSKSWSLGVLEVVGWLADLTTAIKAKNASSAAMAALRLRGAAHLMVVAAVKSKRGNAAGSRSSAAHRNATDEDPYQAFLDLFRRLRPNKRTDRQAILTALEENRDLPAVKTCYQWLGRARRNGNL